MEFSYKAFLSIIEIIFGRTTSGANLVKKSCETFKLSKEFLLSKDFEDWCNTFILSSINSTPLFDQPQLVLRDKTKVNDLAQNRSEWFSQEKICLTILTFLFYLQVITRSSSFPIRSWYSSITESFDSLRIQESQYWYDESHLFCFCFVLFIHYVTMFRSTHCPSVVLIFLGFSITVNATSDSP